MADGIITYVDGVAMLVTPDGNEYRWSDVQRYNNPGMDFDDVTGEPLMMLPTISDTPTTTPSRSLGSRVGNEDIDAGLAMMTDADASLYNLLDPSGRYSNTLLGRVNRAALSPLDILLGGLTAGSGALSKGMGYASDALGLGLQPGDIPDAEEMGQIADALYALPASRMLGAASEAGGRAAAIERMRRRGGPEPLGSAAADAYMLGDRLVPASSYRTETPGRPSQVMLPGGARFDAKPINPIEQAALEYMQRRGMDTTPMGEYPEFSEQRARMIAAAYDQMLDDPGNPAVKRAYDAMVQETLDQYNALKNSGIEFKFLREGMRDPYEASPALGYQDLVENGRLYVFPTDFGYGADVGSDYFDPRTNPLLTRVGRIGDKDDAVANDAFRAVHDAYGHFGPGNPFFRHKGEERAFLEHSRMYSPEARGAMTSETRGQNSWLNFGPYGDANRKANVGDTVFAEQKIGAMPSWSQDPYGMPPEDEIQSILEYIDRWSKKNP